MAPTCVRLLYTCLPLLGLTGSCAATDEPPRNLVIIVVDTLRADALGLYGSELETSPHIDAFGRESVVFDRAWAQGTYTLSSYMSYMTSTYVRTHGLDYPPPILYPPGGVCGWTDLETLPERLAGHGFRCDAYVANASLHPRSGFPRGFDTWNDLRVDELPGLDLRGLAYHIDDPTVVARARLALSSWAPGARHFLYFHLFGPHLPIEPSDEARERFELAVDFAPYGRLTVWQANRWRQEPNAEQREIVRRAYGAGVFDADRHVGAILSAIDESGHRDDTIVALLSDHGQQIWEHGDYGHERGVWHQLVHVPLVVRVPGVSPDRVRGRAVQLIDLAPTLLTLLGIDDPPDSWQGADLFGQTERTGAFSERGRQVAITIDGRAKGMLGNGGWQFFDLAADPTEQRNRPETADWLRLRKPYADWRKRTPLAERDWKAEPVDFCGHLSGEESDERREMLRALGYVE